MLIKRQKWQIWLPESGWKVIPQSGASRRKAFVAESVVCSGNNRLSSIAVKKQETSCLMINSSRSRDRSCRSEEDSSGFLAELADRGRCWTIVGDDVDDVASASASVAEMLLVLSSINAVKRADLDAASDLEVCFELPSRC